MIGNSWLVRISFEKELGIVVDYKYGIDKSEM